MPSWKTQKKEYWEEYEFSDYDETDDWLDDQVENDEMSAEEAGIFRGARGWHDERRGEI